MWVYKMDLWIAGEDFKLFNIISEPLRNHAKTLPSYKTTEVITQELADWLGFPLPNLFCYWNVVIQMTNNRYLNVSIQ